MEIMIKLLTIFLPFVMIEVDFELNDGNGDDDDRGL